MCHHVPGKVARSKKRCCGEYMSLLSKGNNKTGEKVSSTLPPADWIQNAFNSPFFYFFPNFCKEKLHH